MGKIKDKLRHIKYILHDVFKHYPTKTKFGEVHETTLIGLPNEIGNPQNLFLDEFVNLRFGLCVINTANERVFVKKYSVIAPNCTIITNSHCPTVGIPQFILGESHVHDKTGDVSIKEDVWIGANSTILSGVTIGRGAVIGACSLVTKNIPPYALAVGTPARVVAVKFSKQGILQHEQKLYNIDERMTEYDIDDLFDKHFKGLHVFGIEDGLTETDANNINALKKKYGLIEQHCC